VHLSCASRIDEESPQPWRNRQPYVNAADRPLALRTPRPLPARQAIARHDADAGARLIVPEPTADCPQRDSAALMERCDILFPDLLKLVPPR